MKKYAILALTAVMATSILTVPAKASTDGSQGILPGGCVITGTRDYCDMEPRNEGIVPYFLRTCRPGDVGRDVQHLQCSLTHLGYKNLGVVGIFGPRTEKAVKDFQEKHGLEVDGIVTPEVWKVIMDA
ncbi:putative peptidoglycan binding domain protein [Clostridium argentinense CDC 2741]|uniref:Putative peptidoglycan binding domain protein n=1 Tax=Clostridium argentinense CDC 2741 TaxID=1418104 RepID=A0A0C1TX90_9CLOT|nr:peptidoglycan-binding domain-containing protein [Clostridium argentinense]KIE45294.1 putative peptidoglycan binding domain protein [Clostridium argentinense CDC 2741]NFF40626.1 peptidoglycan-binding protein [Clostridium argentinense]NFP51135.1 peptidoglycan-binding protein [Clostridium argentinense]NFP73267.1 peptidoglycan-binding protein [Clostridium argentinense]NFP77788.1 peptidoglycan-binding protein [Clostridium argentinense]